ncbi:Protein SKT5 [Wickerhamiella sorbophila]|uniref:Protein SKT5 n=1 Tax=Wickerhamiella sorbophila TaxID=45607 RepID=A0A2T0FNW8_9ASCO|nr:Protein SKT5 [Wickerhamiella sorbophila]PRT56675.1 Protein SKT5 [Wickerhamiella sorbophila]
MSSNQVLSRTAWRQSDSDLPSEDDSSVLAHHQVKHHTGYEHGYSYAPEVRAGSILYATDTSSPDIPGPSAGGPAKAVTMRSVPYAVNDIPDNNSSHYDYEPEDGPMGPPDGVAPPQIHSPEPDGPLSGFSQVPNLDPTPNMVANIRHLSPDVGSLYSDARSSREPSPRKSSPAFAGHRKTGSASLEFWMPTGSQSPQPQQKLSPRANVFSSSSSRVFELSAVHEGANSEALMPRLKTIELYRKNAQKSNDPVIQFQLAQYMVQTALMPGYANEEEKVLKEKLLKEALAFLRRLAERGHSDAQYLLGDVYSSGAVGGKPDHKQAFHFFLLGAKHGHGEASYRAALCLEEGWGTSRDAGRALKFYRAAAARNQPGALYRLGMIYFFGGLGISDNSNNRLAGIKWLTRAVNAATEIYNRAPYDLAKIYEAGYKDIVFKDLPYAVKLYVRSAELGFIPAAFKLGQAYEMGLLNCPQDSALSIHYYTIGALGNDPRCQLALCAWYSQGAEPHFPVNEDEAYEWALRAAHNGLPKAQYIVGVMLSKGLGCDRDIYMSTQWLKKAAANGFEPAVKRLKSDASNDSNKECVIM